MAEQLKERDIDKLKQARAALSFTVPGVAAPQGSKTRTRHGGMREANPATLPWRAQVTWYAIQAMSGLDKLTGPVEIWADFTMRRPKSHYTRAGVLKLSAPVWCETRPDADKLARAVGDALTGVVFRDDCQVAKWTIRKRYGDAPGVRVEVTVLERYSR